MKVDFFIFAVFIKVHSVYGKNASLPEERIALINENHWNSWIPCFPTEECVLKRRRRCLDDPFPYQSCGQIEFHTEKTNIQHCTYCLGHWILTSQSICGGQECAEKKKQFVYTCSNALAQPNCVQIRERFCDLQQTCIGTWIGWSQLTNCQNRFYRGEKIETNFCRGVSCLNAPFAAKYRRVSCKTPKAPISSKKLSSTTTTTTTTLKAATTSRFSGIQNGNAPSRINSTISLTKVKLIYNPSLWWNHKTYILIIQSLIILVLLVIICLLCRKLRKKKPKKQMIPMVQLETTVQKTPPAPNRENKDPVNAGGNQLSEYEKMRSRNQFSLPVPPRPLPERPKRLSWAPEKPPRRNRASTIIQRPQSFTSLNPKTEVKLTIPQITKPLYSAPTTPAQRNAKKEEHKYGSIGELSPSKDYLLPIN